MVFLRESEILGVAEKEKCCSKEIPKKAREGREGQAVQICTSAVVQLRGRLSTVFQWDNFLRVDFPEGLSYRFQTAVKFLISPRAKIIIKTLNAGFLELGFQGKQLCNV